MSTDRDSYLPGQNVVVTWSQLAGNPHDWIAIAPAGASATDVTRWIYTAGEATGTATFPASTTVGSYVARAFTDDSYDEVSESPPFTISTSAVTVAASTAVYGFSQDIMVNWTGLAGSASDWLALVPAADHARILHWVYTGGSTSGSMTITSPYAAGSFVAIAYTNGSYAEAGESQPFTVGTPSVAASTDASSYQVGQDVTVTWTGLQGIPGDWVALAPQGSSLTTVSRWLYARSATDGHLTFAGGPGMAGRFVARTFSNNTYTLISESAAFDVQ